MNRTIHRRQHDLTGDSHGARTIRQHCGDYRSLTRHPDPDILTLQIRQNSKALRSTAIQAVLQSELEPGTVLIDNAETWDKVISGAQPGGGEELRKAIILYNTFMIDSAGRYHQYVTGFLDPMAWVARPRILPDFVKLPQYGAWRTSLGARTHSQDFLELLDELANRVARERASWSDCDCEVAGKPPSIRVSMSYGGAKRSHRCGPSAKVRTSFVRTELDRRPVALPTRL